MEQCALWLKQYVASKALHGRRKEGGLDPLDFKISSKKRLFSSFEWEKTNVITFGPPPWKILEKSPTVPPENSLKICLH